MNSSRFETYKLFLTAFKMYMVKRKKNRADRNFSSFTLHRYRRNIAHYHYLIGELAKAPSLSETYIHHVINRKAFIITNRTSIY